MNTNPLELSVTEYAALKARGDKHLLLDVREDSELAICRIEGSIHIPLGQLSERIEEIAAWRNDLVVCQCKVGGRSASAMNFLRRQGFTNAVNLSGGILAWGRSVDPSITPY